jgi:hypothetical protein
VVRPETGWMVRFGMEMEGGAEQLAFQKHRVAVPTQDEVQTEMLHPARKYLAVANVRHGVQQYSTSLDGREIDQ